MIDVRLLRSDLDAVRASLARRGDADLDSLVDTMISLDAKLREITAERDAVRAKVNELSKQVGMLRRDGDAAGAEALQAESRALGETENTLAADHDTMSAKLREVLLVVPNLPHPDSPDGTSDADNPVISGPFLPAGGIDGFAEHQRVPHWEIGTDLGILDSERATKIAASMFTMQRGAGATLARALCQYALDANADAFEEVRPPTLVSTATLTSTGQLPKFADDAYAIERDDLWCIPTAEVPLTSMYAGEVLAQADLP
ncbi:MAG: serine--tRNA ligase, partial [Actinomycetota bacterium]|nr:serine--tRNA ligase [Actinomycetota bacterium]